MDSIKLSNIKDMLKNAKKNHYAIAHININNLEWINAVLEASSETNTPVILGVSEGAIKYNNGFQNVHDMVINSMKFKNIKTPIVLHLDHGTFEGSKKAIAVGFSSIMFDGSSLDFNENIEKTKILVDLIKDKNISIECEIGSIGGAEDDVSSNGDLSSVDECIEMSNQGIDALAVGVGSIHGLYPKNWKGLDFDLLKKINAKCNDIPLVLHGGTGINDEMIRKAISLGVSKINVNTECQLAFVGAIRKYIEDDKDLDTANKGYDPRMVLKVGVTAIKNKCIEKFELFGSLNKAN